MVDVAGAVGERGPSEPGARIAGTFRTANSSLLCMTIWTEMADVALTVVHRRGIGWTFSVWATLLAATRSRAVSVCRTLRRDAQRFI